ncbi:nitrilase-related carbon-nitrogen hydrolase [Tabrizicola oligotrophica]|uniref:Nitrilase n=1 Tax=Tabrizicola oligotrophica TaxID=2710650 RepID=A0A6M0QTH5_9RHOB|nr:nitrilase-related carbon-nitrogen hydrolase [Tabrizicola oligotrophica]NEY89742.1 nitrilase [Tabrizicola oligotrophica]
MRLSVLQSPSPAGDIDAACAALEAALRAAAAAGADVLVAPEVFLPGYNQSRIADLALARDGAVLARLSAAAKAGQTALVFGYAEALEGRVYNSALCFGPDGQTLAQYRKIQLYGPREKAIYFPGDAFVTFDLAGRKLALLICYDIEFAPHVAALAARGVEAILVPTANMMPFTHVVRHTVPAMAANHGLAIAYANYCGSEGDLTYVGGSLIAGPHGEVLAQAGEHPALLIADVPAVDTARVSTQRLDFRKI